MPCYKFDQNNFHREKYLLYAEYVMCESDYVQEMYGIRAGGYKNM